LNYRGSTPWRRIHVWEVHRDTLHCGQIWWRLSMKG
jgi:hypothetical protein